MTRVCVLKAKEACLLGLSRLWGNCTEEGTRKEKSENNEREGEQREIPTFRKEAEDLSTEDQG